MPIPLINSIASWFLKKRMHQIELFIKYPNEVQNDILLNLVKSAKETFIGQKFDFKSINNYEDFSERDDKNWMKHTVMWLDDENKSSITYRDVTLTTLTNEVESIPPVARVY